MTFKKKFWRCVKYFRGGYTSYIGFTLMIINFILLFHNFVIPKIDFLKGISVFWFGILTFTLLILISIPFGWLHFNSDSFKQEAEIQWDKNPRAAELTRIVKEIREEVSRKNG